MMFFGLIVAVLLVVFLFDQRPWGERSPFYGPDRQRKTPLEILKDRYARGEISKSEYEEMKEDLRRS